MDKDTADGTTDKIADKLNQNPLPEWMLKRPERFPPCLEHRNNDKDLYARGLCKTCYMRLYRNGELENYPTTGFALNPEQYIRWAFEHYPDLIGDIAIEYRLKVEQL